MTTTTTSGLPSVASSRKQLELADGQVGGRQAPVLTAAAGVLADDGDGQVGVVGVPEGEIAEAAVGDQQVAGLEALGERGGRGDGPVRTALSVGPKTQVPSSALTSSTNGPHRWTVPTLLCSGRIPLFFSSTIDDGGGLPGEVRGG